MNNDNGYIIDSYSELVEYLRIMSSLAKESHRDFRCPSLKQLRYMNWSILQLDPTQEWLLDGNIINLLSSNSETFLLGYAILEQKGVL